MLKSLGFFEVVGGLHTFEQSVKVEIGFARSDDVVDLHRNLPMLPTPDEVLWEAFSAGTETIAVGNVQACVLDRTALALHVVVHAVQHGFQWHTSEDLRRAVTVMSVDDWRRSPTWRHDWASRESSGWDCATRRSVPKSPTASLCRISRRPIPGLGCSRYLVSDGNLVEIEPCGTAAAGEVRRFLRMTPTAALYLQRGIPVLHAAVAADPAGHAIVLAGNSSVGKSVLLAALVQRGWGLLADDLAPVTLDAAGVPVAMPTWPEMILWPDAVGVDGRSVVPP